MVQRLHAVGVVFRPVRGKIQTVSAHTQGYHMKGAEPPKKAAFVSPNKNPALAKSEGKGHPGIKTETVEINRENRDTLLSKRAADAATALEARRTGSSAQKRAMLRLESPVGS